MGIGKNWTKEEELYLEENWGTRSIQAIAKQLGRSVNAINVRKTRMGLGRFLDSGEYITYCQLLQILSGSSQRENSYSTTFLGKDFPVKKKRRGKNSYRVVYLNEFWTWAEEHKRLIDFSRVEENILGAEPEWAKRKRKIDFMCRVNTKPWTRAEDDKLKRMLAKYRYSYTDIAAELNRTEGAVKRRICTLDLKERPMRAENKSWTEEDVQTLVFMYEEGYSYEYIGRELHRSALACRGRMERIEHPERSLRSYRNHRTNKRKGDPL